MWEEEAACVISKTSPRIGQYAWQHSFDAWVSDWWISESRKVTARIRTPRPTSSRFYAVGILVGGWENRYLARILWKVLEELLAAWKPLSVLLATWNTCWSYLATNDACAIFQPWKIYYDSLHSILVVWVHQSNATRRWFPVRHSLLLLLNSFFWKNSWRIIITYACPLLFLFRDVALKLLYPLSKLSSFAYCHRWPRD